MIRSRKLLNTAKGQECTLRFPGICHGGTETTVFCHLNFSWAGKGMGQKAHDILGVHGCYMCHVALDQSRHNLSSEEFYLHLLRAMCETYVRVVEMGVVVVPRDAEILPKDRQVKPRKPREERVKIPRSAKKQWPKRGFGK